MRVVAIITLAWIPGWAYGILGMGLLTVIWTALKDRRRKNRLRRDHANSHRNMNDEEFARVVGVEGSEGVAASRVRRAIAAAMAVPTGSLLPSDGWSYIGPFIGFDGMDHLDIEIIVENALQIRISKEDWHQFWAGEHKGDLAGLIRFLAGRKRLQES